MTVQTLKSGKREFVLLSNILGKTKEQIIAQYTE